MKRMTSSGAELSGEEASPVLQFFSWNGVSKVGEAKQQQQRCMLVCCLAV
jgi:hypothetical protein